MPILNHLVKKVQHTVRGKVSGHISSKEDEREQDYMTEGHRYDSFAPIRQEAMVKYYIDGHDYCW